MTRKSVKVKQTRNKTLRTGDRDHIPLPTGPYDRIGCRDFMCGLTRKNGVLFRMFYPAAETKSVNNNESSGKDGSLNPLVWPNWLPHEAYRQGYADVANLKSPTLINLLNRTCKQNVFIPAKPNARLAPLPPGQKYPVVIFSHGLGACRTTYSAICTELASHGFIVLGKLLISYSNRITSMFLIAIEHRDNSACLSFYARRARYSFKNSNPNFFDNQVDGKKQSEDVGEGEGDVVDGDDEVDFGDEIDDPNYVPPKALEALSTVPYLELDWVRHRYVSLTNTSPPVHNFRNKQVHHRVREAIRALDVIEALNSGYELNNLLDPGFNKNEFEDMIGSFSLNFTRFLCFTFTCRYGQTCHDGTLHGWSHSLDGWIY